MSEGVEVKLRTLLPESLPHMEGAVRSEIKEHGVAGLPGVAWKLAGDKAEDAVREALDGGLYELLAKAWGTARELHEYKDEAKHPVAEKSIVQLGEHELSTSVHPELAFTVAGKKLPPMRLTLELSVKVNAVALTVQKGHIRELSAGDFVVSAQLKCGETPLHDAVKTTPVALPGTWTLRGEGVAIL